MTGRHTQIAIVGGGWAGLAAAVAATQAGHQVTVFEAARHWGGRARALPEHRRVGAATLDNGQHILIGAYTQTLSLMRLLGVDPEQVLQQVPLQMRYPDGSGWHMPSWVQDWPPPLDTLAAVLCQRSWSWRDRLLFLRAAIRWQRAGFRCAPQTTVAALCLGIPASVQRALLEPLCVSALNTPMAEASGQLFLRVLRDALFAPAPPPYKASDLLVPKAPLSTLLPTPARLWLEQHGARLHAGAAVKRLAQTGLQWAVATDHGTACFDHVVLACPLRNAARLVAAATPLGTAMAETTHGWLEQAQRLRHEDLTTVYSQHAADLPWPMSAPLMALHSDDRRPAQFVFNRGELGGPPGLLAWVVSAPRHDRLAVEALVRAQAAEVFPHHPPIRVTTVCEKQATFAATPDLERPGHYVAPGLWAAGDAVDGPYPATLEGAVRSGQAVVRLICACT